MYAVNDVNVVLLFAWGQPITWNLQCNQLFSATHVCVCACTAAWDVQRLQFQWVFENTMHLLELNLTEATTMTALMPQSLMPQPESGSGTRCHVTHTSHGTWQLSCNYGCWCRIWFKPWRMRDTIHIWLIISGWWFQPIWKNICRIGSSSPMPIYGTKKKLKTTIQIYNHISLIIM